MYTTRVLVEKDRIAETISGILAEKLEEMTTKLMGGRSVTIIITPDIKPVEIKLDMAIS